MFAVLCSDGAIKVDDVIGTIRNEQWVPLAVTRPRNDPKATPTLLLFNDKDTARRFAQKNFPKDWLVSVVELAAGEHQWIKERGWHTEVVSYARLMNSHPEYQLTYEVLEFQTKPDVGIVNLNYI